MEFFGDLAVRGISLVEQPRVFESVVPPDRRRWASLPGGAPAPELLWSVGGARSMLELVDEDISSDLAQALLANERTLIDIAPAVGCVCSGALRGVDPAGARPSVAALEPPRSPAPVVDVTVKLSLDARPVAHDSLVLPRPSPSTRRAPPPPPPLVEMHASPSEPPREAPPVTETLLTTPVVPEQLEREILLSTAASLPLPLPKKRTTPTSTVRHNSGGFPKTRSSEGRALPRAYAAKRKSAQGLRVDGAEPERSESPAVDAERMIARAVEPDIPRSAGAHDVRPEGVASPPREPAADRERAPAKHSWIPLPRFQPPSASNVPYIITVLAFVGLAVVVLRSLF
jgi:hypothetical protein